jgi:predicted TIM-barrel fold metal-dependent hydrolase
VSTVAPATTEIPKIVSADDHVVEPGSVWIDRLPAKYAEVGPRVLRAPVAEMRFYGGNFTFAMGDEGPLADWWVYEDLAIPHTRLTAAAGYPADEVKVVAMTYDEMRPGCYEQAARLADMDANWVEASICFPTFPRFCGQTFLEAKDKDLALLCVQAYNDWIIDEWCAGSGGRLVPLTLVPLWDPTAAGDEVRRNAARGARAVCFSELPSNLGLPSIHAADRHWDPFIAACDETGTVICMHIGSGSKMPSTSADAPPAVSASMNHQNAEASLLDWLFSGVLVRYPDLKITYSEGQIGWIPYTLARADRVWDHNRGYADVGDVLPEPPSHYYRDRVYGCFFEDPAGMVALDVIGVDKVTFETDYPHSDGTWPRSKEVASTLLAGLDDASVRKILRDNTIRLFQLDR